MLKEYSKLASQKNIQNTIEALKENGIEAEFVEIGADAKRRVFELLPEGADIMTQTSVTLSTLGIADEINGSSKYNPARAKFKDQSQREKQKSGAAPEWTIGSVHAVTMDGSVLIASNTGSQLPSYVYGADHVIWVVGAQKIVANVDEGIKRIHEYVLPLEDARAQKAYGMGSNVSKLLIINKEVKPGRIHLIFVNEVLGF
ncbi:MAG: hypothetical protein A3H72_03170 [Candidatus Doudnabacteria bacterium RIFCSPLOWO2_02_FULL_48_8]|uniref:LUD domain-containing protein n=1 Tax=Candidatus Doudnabacteria bacterium RIFCSPHIGHO2_01_FULL_46_24 TaxID=1817825 RepID=A0A1F5NUW5_9BACT|nr:MAG: hypothetical protein A2720_01200 [Candidatus Doudnabacteria bacterium RIFCSPHIGHO2_01_FULL_46_24]OGE95210.1 MAG: hypothetical protein A3H72_03170 [Candidatus Doudnabacteria bacterium RIFCSPLOWO2_02_FULL_48_8]OGE96085.1 MAG: hypothetical protein A3E98_02460 [Candidatus Doudnabacteria bacterium RIFCSPHIGHO2_12_FULL_48_11]